ncbi:DUF3800 domain-containing protein [Oceanimonas doudoroffii]|uniref:DUF3800 domain-containing protein n=1 Tax=Oceanimonas doudoroffii TaxID=84158 RepID=UPI001140506B|nr:DUF3800 domain-containing protein [Oceanimonas doudoroffii]
MYIAIDDTYGPIISTGSKYVTGNRRTNVGVAFPDKDVFYIREQITNCIGFIKSEFSIEPNEFHFVDIYNRKGPWGRLPDKANLAIFSAFAEIYGQHKWKVFIQTIDDRTLRDHDIKKIKGRISQFILEKPSDLSLLWLLIKIKIFYSNTPENLNVFIDEGLGKPNSIVGNEIFHNFPNNYEGKFQSSHEEPLLQVADFLAFVINRSTHLYMKQNRTEIDNWFLWLFNNMDINSVDLSKTNMTGKLSEITVSDFDGLHENDRSRKGLQSS